MINKRILYLFFLIYILGILPFSIIPLVSAAEAICDPEFESCGGGGGSCIPTTCTILGKSCGSWDNGCGTLLNCGTCSSDQTCSNGQCVNNPTCYTTGCSNGYICDRWGGTFGSPYCSCPSGTVQVTHYDYTLNRTIIDRTYTGYQACTVEVSPGVWTQIQCVNTQTSTSNCGSCGNVCASGLSCVSGNCQCSAGTTPCPTGCKDTANDVQNCGSCGNVCGTGINSGNQFCISGKCVQCRNKGTGDCADGQACINNACIVTCSSLGGFCGPNGANNTYSDELKLDCDVYSCLYCNNGYGNCNSGSGCETDITTISNCGSCNNVCTASNFCSGSNIYYVSPICSSSLTCGTTSSSPSPCPPGADTQCTQGICVGNACGVGNKANTVACTKTDSGQKYCDGSELKAKAYLCSNGVCGSAADTVIENCSTTNKICNTTSLTCVTPTPQCSIRNEAKGTTGCCSGLIVTGDNYCCNPLETHNAIDGCYRYFGCSSQGWYQPTNQCCLPQDGVLQLGPLVAIPY